MEWLLALAVLAQSADAAYSCKALSNNGFREANPFLGSTCKSVVLGKSATFIPLIVLPPDYRKAWTIGLIGGGAVGLTLSIALNK